MVSTSLGCTLAKPDRVMVSWLAEAEQREGPRRAIVALSKMISQGLAEVCVAGGVGWQASAVRDVQQCKSAGPATSCVVGR